MKNKSYKTATRLVHKGRDSNLYGGLVNPPTFRGSTVIFKNLEEFYGKRKVKSYSTRGTPGSDYLIDLLLTLEGVENGHAVFQPSGLASITLLLLGLHKQGDHILVSDSAYSPCKEFCKTNLRDYGIEVEFYSPRIKPDELSSKIKKNTKTLYLESPASISFIVQDIPALVKVAKQHKIKTVLDNTWSAGYFFKAFDHDIDFVIYAMTKHQLGHSNGLMGAVLCKEKNKKLLEDMQNARGLCCGSHEIEQALQGIRNLETRMLRLQESSMKIALWLKEQNQVAQVLYPALPDSQDYELWKRDFTGACSPFSFSLKENNKNSSKNFIEALNLFKLGFSWAGYESLLIPVDSSYFNHCYTDNRDKNNSYFRIYVGMEDPDDLIEDLQSGFTAYTK